MSPTLVTDNILFTYTVKGEPIFVKKRHAKSIIPTNGSLSMEVDNIVPLSAWTPEQLEAMAKFMRDNPGYKRFEAV
jgi:hypothetical protein